MHEHAEITIWYLMPQLVWLYKHDLQVQGPEQAKQDVSASYSALEFNLFLRL